MAGQNSPQRGKEAWSKDISSFKVLAPSPGAIDQFGPRDNFTKTSDRRHVQRNDSIDRNDNRNIPKDINRGQMFHDIEDDLRHGAQEEHHLPTINTQEETLDDVEFWDGFKRCSEAHTRLTKLLEESRKENLELRTRLNSVLQATWHFSEDSWLGKPHEAEETELRLTSQNKMIAWTVPEDFENPNKEVEEPAKFTTRDTWKEKERGNDFDALEQVQQRKFPTSATGDLHLLSTDGVAALEPMETEELVMVAPEGTCSFLVISPTSTTRLVWDCFSVVLLLYDIIMVPMDAFKPAPNALMIVMDWVTLVFWTFDMFASFLTGYTDHGYTVMHPVLIAKHYMRGWFILDVFAVLPDWIFTLLTLAMAGAPSGSNFAKLIRIFRIVRVLRLLRLAKMQRLLTLLKDSIESEVVFKVVTICQILVGLFFSNHFLCSGWYMIGDVGLTLKYRSWIEVDDLMDMALPYRYLSSLHFTIAHFGLADVGANPANSMERIYAIFLACIGMVFFWTMTAYITTSMLQLVDTHGQVGEQMWLLRRYLRQNDAPGLLTYRVLRFAEKIHKTRRDVIPESKVSIIPLLSENLRFELKYMVYFIDIHAHPLFDKAHDKAANTMYALSRDVIVLVDYAKGDEVFRRSIWAKHMWWVVSGELSYDRKNYFKELVAGDWMCEAVLWVPWVTRGKAIASADCSLMRIDAKGFCRTISADAALLALMSNYAMNFAAWLNESAADDLIDVFLHGKSLGLIEGFMETQREEREVSRKRKKKEKAATKAKVVSVK